MPRKHLREFTHRPAAKSHLAERHQWADEQFECADWDSFSSARNKHAKKNPQFCHKACNRKLPTGLRLHSRQEKHDQRCATRWHRTEDDDHITQCSARRRKLSNAIIAASKKKTFPHMDPVLTHMLRDGVISHIHQMDPPTPALTECSLRCQQLLLEQRAMGWDDFFRGKASQQWEWPQDDCKTKKRLNRMPDVKKGNKKAPERAMSTVASATIQSLRGNWRERCKERHRPEKGRKALANVVEATREITFLCSLKEAVCIEDQIAFEKPLSIMLEQPLGVMKRWLRNWRDVLPASVSLAETTSKHGTKAMFTCLKDPDKAANNMDRRPKWKLLRRTNAVKKTSEGFVADHFSRQPNRRSASVVSTHVPVIRKQLSIKKMFAHKPKRPELHPDHPG